MKKPGKMKKDMPFVVSSILAAMGMGFLVPATGASEYAYTNHVAPFIFGGIIALWILFLFVYPAMVDDDKELIE